MLGVFSLIRLKDVVAAGYAMVIGYVHHIGSLLSETLYS